MSESMTPKERAEPIVCDFSLKIQLAIREAEEAARLDEREACAKIADAKLKEARELLGKLVDSARTSGGTAGRDEHLCDACSAAEAFLSRNKEAQDE